MIGVKTLSTYCKLYKLTTRTLNVKSLAPFLRHFPQYNHRVSISSGTRTLCMKSNDDALKSAPKTCTLHKGVIEVSGVDMVGFLQGIVTNDVNCLAEHSCEAMYSYILNPQVLLQCNYNELYLLHNLFIVFNIIHNGIQIII